MANITQYDIDMQRQGKMDQGLGVMLQGLQGMQEDRKRALAEKRALEAQDLSLAQSGATPEDIKAYRESGDMTGLQKFFSNSYKTKREEDKARLDREAADSQLDREYKRSQIGLNEASAREKTLPWDQTREAQAYKSKLQLEKEQKQNDMQNSLNQEAQKKIVGNNVQLSNVRNAMAEALTKLEDKNLPEDQKIKVGQSLFKLLNSAEGADAVGAEEAKRLGSYLEYQKFNMTDPGAFWGRDVNGFTDQVRNYRDVLDGRIRRNEDMANGLRQGRSFSELTQQPQIPAPVAQKLQSMTPEQKQQRLMELRQKAGR